MKLSGVRLSVRLFVRPIKSAAARLCGGFAVVGPASGRYWSTAAAPGAAGTAARATARRSV